MAAFERNLPQDVATDRSASSHEIRKASQSRAFGSPVPGEGRVRRMRRTPLQEVVAGPLAEQDCAAKRPNSPADGEEQMRMANTFCRYLELATPV